LYRKRGAQVVEGRAALFGEATGLWVASVFSPENADRTGAKAGRWRFFRRTVFSVIYKISGIKERASAYPVAGGGENAAGREVEKEKNGVFL